jgi:hypothetical protein
MIDKIVREKHKIAAMGLKHQKTANQRRSTTTWFDIAKNNAYTARDFKISSIPIFQSQLA